MGTSLVTIGATGATLVSSGAALRATESRTALMATRAAKSSGATGATVMLLRGTALGTAEVGATRASRAALGRALVAVVLVLVVVVVEETHD